MEGKASSEPAGRQSTFIAEHLWPGVTLETATAEVERLVLAANELRRDGRPVHHVGSSLIPKDETIFNWFRAASPDDVAAIGELAGVRFDRIVLVIELETSPVEPPTQDGD